MTGDTDKVRVSWNSSSGATSYDVWRGTSSSSSSASIIKSSTTSTSYDDTSASPGTIYYYWVKAKNVGGTSGFSSVNSGYRQVLPPSAPSGVSASDGTYTDKVRVSWNSSSGATSYDVWRGTSSSSSSASIIKSSTTSTSYDDTSASPGTIYYYWVKAKNSGGTSGFSSYNTGYRQYEKPEIVRTSPSTPVAINSGLPLQFNAEASAAAGLYGIEWFVGSVSEQYTSYTASYDYYEEDSFTYTFESAGTYYVYAYVYDRASPQQEDFVTWQVVVSTPPPPAPSGVSASDGAYTDKVSVSWNSSSGATSYEVWRHTSNSSGSASCIGTPIGTSFDDTSAVAGTIYYYWVKAKNVGGTSGFSSANSGYRQVLPPSAPSGVSASDGTYTDKVRVSWNSVSGATSYEVWRGVSSSSSSSSLIKSTTSTSYDDTSATTGTTYYYWVKSINDGGSGISAYDTGYRQYTMPEIVRTSPSSPVSVYTGVAQQFNAEASAAAGLYGIEWFVGSASEQYTSYTASYDYYEEDSFTYTFESAGTYYVYAYVYDRASSQQEAFVTWTVNVSTLLPSAPTGVSASDGTYTDKVRVSWNLASGATSYEIWRSTSSTPSSSSLIKSTTSTSYDDTSAATGTTYYYWVKSINDGGSSISTYDTGYRQYTMPEIVRTSPSSPVSVYTGVAQQFNAEASAAAGLYGIEWFVGSASEQYTSYTASYDYYEEDSFTYTFNSAGTYYIHAYVYDRASSQQEAFTTWEVNVSVPPGYASFSVYDTTGGASVGGATIHTFDADWSNRQEYSTVLGSAKTIEFEVGDHPFEIEKDDNYWGYGSVTVNAGATVPVNFTRNAPAFSSWDIQDKAGNPLTENADGRYEVASGQELRVVLFWEHSLDEAKRVKTTVALDSSLTGNVYEFGAIPANTNVAYVYDLTVPASASAGDVLQPYFQLNCIINEGLGEWKRTDYATSSAFDLEVQEISYPTVNSVSPANGETGVSTESIIYIDFSEPMDEASVEDAGNVTLEKSDGTMVSGTVDYLSGIGNVRAEFIPDGDLYAPETYTLTIKGGSSGVKDIEGQYLQSDYTSSFTTQDGSVQTTITFARKQWYVKSGEGGPGPNKWSNSDNSVWVDNEGRLHLRIRQLNGEWVCPEIWSQESFGYGRYTFKVDTNVEELDKNTVVGLFTYLDDENEIDIEFSRWGSDANPAGNYVVQPSWIDGQKIEGNHKAFNLGLSGDYSTHSFTWLPDEISYLSWHGHAEGTTLLTNIKSWNYSNADYIPMAGNEKVHLNFWLLDGGAPSDSSESEVVISDFEFIPSGDLGAVSFVKNMSCEIQGNECIVDTVFGVDESGDYAVIVSGFGQTKQSIEAFSSSLSNMRQFTFSGVDAVPFVEEVQIYVSKEGSYDHEVTGCYAIRDVESVNEQALESIGMSASAQDVQDILTRFSPVLKTDYVVTDGEHIKDRCPKSIDSILGNAQLLLSDGSAILAPSLSTLVDNNHSGNTIDFRDPFISSDNAQWASFIDGLDNAVYGRITYDQFDGEYVIVAQYWLPYYASFMKRVIPWTESPFANYHEGETENISVVLGNRNGVLTPISAFYAKHYKGDTIQWENVRKYGDASGVTDHPVVYVSLGSHASFFSPESPEDTKSDGTEGNYHQGRGYWYGAFTGDETYNDVKILRDSDNWLFFSGSWGEVPSFPFVKYSWADWGASDLYRWVNPGGECDKWISDAGLSYDYSADDLSLSYDEVIRSDDSYDLIGLDVTAADLESRQIHIYYLSRSSDWIFCDSFDPNLTCPIISVPTDHVEGNHISLKFCDVNDTGELDPVTGQHNPGTFEYFRLATTNISIVHLLGPETPTNGLPADDSTIYETTPLLTWSLFVDGGDGDTQAGFDVLIRNSDTDAMVHSNYVASTTANSYQVPDGILNFGSNYHWHVRYKDSGGQWSAWSADTPETHHNFSTAEPGKFTIYSAHGSPDPAAGSYNYTPGQQMFGGSVDSPTVGANGVRHRCFGYSGTGDAPQSGSGLSYPTFTINQDSTLTWEWTAQYEATSSAGNNGSVSPLGSTWADAGASIVYTATPDTGYQVDYWEVNGLVVQDDSTEYTLSDLSEPATVAVYFSVIPADQYTLTFESAGGTAVDPITQESGTTVTAPVDPTRTGYTFMGWNPVVPATMPAENQTLTAQWSISKYTLTFNSAGGTTVDPITQDYGSVVTPPANPTRTGYTFVGWIPAVPTTMPAENLTLTALYEADSVYYSLTVENGTGDGSYTNGAVVDIVANTSLTGQVFSGWSIIPVEYAGNIVNTNEASTIFTMPATNVTLTAEYTVIPGLIAYYPLDGDAIDATGNGHDGTLYGNASFCSSISRTGVIFDGLGDYIDLDLKPIVGEDDSLSISFWAKMSTACPATPTYILGLEQTGGQEIVFRVFESGTPEAGQIGLYFRTDSYNKVILYSVNDLCDGNWHHFAGICDKTIDIVAFYVDGKLVDQDAAPSGNINVSSSRNLYLGANNNSSTPAKGPFAGILDEVWIHGRALREDEVASLTDTDCDGMLDCFEMRIINTLADDAISTIEDVHPHDDFDGDGQNALDEYIAGTDPTLASSRFMVNSLSRTQDSNAVSWTAVDGRVYDVFWTSSLSREFILLESGIAYPVSSYSDMLHSSRPAGFYTVKVRLPGGSDTDGDGLPDVWESEFFSNSTSAVAGYDSDGDGCSNIQEYLAGTNPTNAVSYFSVSLNLSNLLVPDGRVIVEWNAVEGRYYNVLWAPSLNDSFISLKSGLDYPTNCYTDTVHSVDQKGYYRVDVHLIK